MDISEIVKTGKFYVDYPPAFKVGIGSIVGSIGTPTTTLVSQGDANINPVAISKWIEATSKGYMCCYLNASKQLVTGYCSDLDFLTIDNAIESEVTQAAIVASYAGRNSLDIVRLADGGALLAELDRTDYGSIIRIYASTSGDGGDWALLTSLVSWQTSALSRLIIDSTECNLTIDSDGKLFLATNEQFDYSGGYSRNKAVIYTSGDNGLTWTLRLDVGGSVTAIRGISQVAFLPDRCWCAVTRVNYTTLYKSTDDGDTWTEVGNIESPYFDDITATTVQGVCFYYEELTDTVVAHITYPYTNDAGSFILENSTSARLDDLTNFVRIASFSNLTFYGGGTNNSGRIYSVGGKLAIQAINNTLEQVIYHAEIIPGSIRNVKSVTVVQAVGQAGGSTVELDNKGGVYSYDGSENLHKIGPNESVTVHLGYGAYLEKVFYGIIDRITEKSPPQSMTIVARDRCKLALDGTAIRPTDGFRTFSFVAMTLEDVFATLAGWAGYTDINTDVTGIDIDLLTLTWSTYADAFGQLCDLCAFDWWVDVEGAIYFRMRASNEPRVMDEEHTLILDGSDYVCTLDKTPILSGSDVLTDTAGTTTYTRYTDYTINLATGRVVSVAGGALASGGTVRADYTHPRHSFSEGDEMTSIAYTITDVDLYYKVVAYGLQAGANPDDAPVAIKATYTLTSQLFNVQINKIKKLDIEGIVKQAQLQKISDTVGGQMRYRCRYVEVTAIAVPTVKVGDCVQIEETSTTISEIYRVSDLNYTFEKDKLPMMEFKAYYAGYAPIGGETE